MKTKEQIEEFLENELRDSELVSVWNEYCEQNAYYDDQLQDMSMFDDYVGYGKTATEVLESMSSDFNIRDNYFYYNIYGFESTDYPEDHIDFDAMAKYIYDNDDALGNDELDEFLHEDDEEV